MGVCHRGAKRGSLAEGVAEIGLHADGVVLGCAFVTRHGRGVVAEAVELRRHAKVGGAVADNAVPCSHAKVICREISEPGIAFIRIRTGNPRVRRSHRGRCKRHKGHGSRILGESELGPKPFGGQKRRHYRRQRRSFLLTGHDGAVYRYFSTHILRADSRKARRHGCYSKYIFCNHRFIQSHYSQNQVNSYFSSESLLSSMDCMSVSSPG